MRVIVFPPAGSTQGRRINIFGAPRGGGIPLILLGGPAVTASAAIALSNSSISEDASVNDVVGVLSVTNGSGSYTFSITADPDNKFAIANDDELQIDATLDYEAKTSHSVTIQATNGITPLSQEFSISVLNVDDTAPTITSSDTVSVDENETLSHSLTANEAVTWSIIGGADQAQFNISGSTLRWVGNGTQNYESPQDADTNNAYVVEVRATDGATLTADQTITVTVNDVSESGGTEGTPMGLLLTLTYAA